MDRFNIIFVASEVVPYAKTGGLADVAGALPKELANFGHKVSVVMPRYRQIQAGRLLFSDLHVPVDYTVKQARVFVDDSAIAPVYFIDAPEYFHRDKLYDEPDDALRFALFGRAALELAKRLGECPSIVHCNDWMTGFIPLYLKRIYQREPFFADTSTLFTIHNLAFHGFFDAGWLPRLGLSYDVYATEGGIEFYGKASMLKAGIVFSDMISTVSKRYAQEIQTEEYGFKLEGLLRSRSDCLVGILNGVDYDEWSPQTDRFIAARYGPENLEGKRACKADLLRYFGLPEEAGRPIVGSISRLTDQKGFDLIMEIAGRMMEAGIYFVLLGSGDKKYESFFQALKDRYSNYVGVYIGFNNELAHKIEAGADMFLMPSRFEPCGLNQIYSLKYGTVPIVRGTGGLDDTIQNFDRLTRQGNGFKFYQYSAEKLLEKVYEALLLYKAEPDLWRALMLNGMREDFSWSASARQYVQLYRQMARRAIAAD